MDLRKVKKLIELVEESSIEELEVSSGDESIRIVMPRGAFNSGANAAVNAGVVTTAPVAPVPTQTHKPPAADAALSVPAPMAGTFYRAPHPDAGAFVEVGQVVQAGDVLCIIESMKMMHEIRATNGGVITQICVANGQPVGTGEALFKLS